MILDTVDEITIHDVYERGIPNREGILLRVHKNLNLTNYCVIVGHYVSSGPQMGAYPINDHFFWFGSAFLKAGDWVFLYTGSGTSTSYLHHGNTVYSVYWGKKTTIFAQSSMVPLVARFDAVKVHMPPQDQPQDLGLQLTRK